MLTMQIEVAIVLHGRVIEQRYGESGIRPAAVSR
ncbi:UNVERIFIED_CONTAM: hypothetical protein ABIC26_001530 [Paenibacillus sp. PvR008]